MKKVILTMCALIAINSVGAMDNMAQNSSKNTTIKLDFGNDQILLTSKDIIDKCEALSTALNFKLQESDSNSAPVINMAIIAPEIDTNSWKLMEAILSNPTISLDQYQLDELADIAMMGDLLQAPIITNKAIETCTAALLKPQESISLLLATPGLAQNAPNISSSSAACSSSDATNSTNNNATHDDHYQVPNHLIQALKESFIQKIFHTLQPQIRRLNDHTNDVTSAACSPDGTKKITIYNQKTVQIWNTHNGRGITTLIGHTNRVNSAAFSPDGTKIVTASDDKTARIWNANDYTRIATLTGHTNRVNSAAFSPDGTKIVTASDDKTVRIWNANDYTCIATLSNLENQPVFSAEFNHNGTEIVTAFWDKTALIYHWTEAIAQLRLMKIENVVKYYRRLKQ